MRTGLLALVYLILFLIAAVEILAARQTVGYKLLWMLLILLLPVIGLILYYVVGRERRQLA